MKPNNSSDTSGTPGYMSPEVMCCQDHSFSSDYYAVGVILY
jgi:serine/threonine protein kinase